MFDRLSGVQRAVRGEGTHFRIPWVQTPHQFDVRIRPRNISSATGTKDLQIVTINLRVLSRPEEEHLPDIFSNLGVDYDWISKIPAAVLVLYNLTKNQR